MCVCARTNTHTHTKFIKLLHALRLACGNPKSHPRSVGIPGRYLVSPTIWCSTYHSFPSLPRRRHHILQFTQKKQQDHSHWHARVVDFTGEFWGPPWKAIHKPLSSGASLLLCLSLFFFFHSPSPSWKLLGTLRAGHGHFAQVLISNMHIQSHLRFQKNKALSIWQASLLWWQLWFRDSKQILLVCCLSLFCSCSTCEVLSTALASGAFWSCGTQLHRCSPATRSFWRCYSF